MAWGYYISSGVDMRYWYVYSYTIHKLSLHILKSILMDFKEESSALSGVLNYVSERLQRWLMAVNLLLTRHSWLKCKELCKCKHGPTDFRNTSWPSVIVCG